MAQRKGLVKTKDVSADGGGIMFSEWLAMVKPSPTKAKASSSPTNDRRILHRQATSQPDAIVQQPVTAPNDKQVVDRKLNTPGMPPAGVVSVPPRFSDPLSWAPKPEPAPTTNDYAAAVAAMVDIGFRRGSSSASHRVLEAHPLNPIGWVAPTVDPATGADKPRRLAQLPLNGASDDAITIEQWLSARGGSGGRGASVSPANGSHTPESAQSQSVTPRRLGFARVHSATDGVMFQGGSSRRRSMATSHTAGIDVSDPSETSAGGPGRAAGVPSGHIHSYINPVTWRELDVVPTPRGGSGGLRELHKQETGLPRHGLPPNTSSPTR